MKILHIVITGGSRGLGRALAHEFLKAGCKVTVNGTSSGRINETVSEFSGLFDGRIADRFSLYGASKRAVRYLTDSFRSELAGKPVYIGVLSPGIVVTDFLINGLPGDPEKRKETVKIYNTLADKPETVAGYLAEGILANNSRNKKREKIAWLTGSRVFFRFLTSAFNRRNLFNE